MTGDVKYISVFVAANSLALISVSCAGSDTPVYSHFEQIGSDGWDPCDMLVFEPWPADSADAVSASFDMELVLRYSMRHPVADLPVAVTVEDEEGTVRSDTVIVNSESRGNVDSKSRYGVREIIFPLAGGVRLTDGYMVTLTPVASREHTKGLLNVGIVMTRPDTRK